jgi:hypothetical protein
MLVFLQSSSSRGVKKHMLRIRCAVWVRLSIKLTLAVCALLLVTPCLRAQDEYDSYHLKIEAYWAYSYPSGTLEGASDKVPIDLNRDLGFNSYSTFFGKADWKFTHKNHLYIGAIPYHSSLQKVLTRPITFRGQTFQAGLTVQSSLDAPMYVFGYQYDIIRRKRGFLGIALQFNAFDTHASINAAAQVVGTGLHGAVSASGSLLAPIPVGGPTFRYYLTDSPRLYVDANFFGMYFFGYGNFLSSLGRVGFSINRHISLNGGYFLGSRLRVHNDSSANRLGLALNQKGPIVGVDFSF